MAINPIVDASAQVKSTSARRADRASAWSGAKSNWRDGFKLFSSLKLTVALMVMAVLVTLVFTFQLTRMDIWQAKSMHFPHLFVFITFQTFFPPKWFPDLQNVPGGMYIPSGFLILSAMLVNLIAAHATRFRIVGTRRAVGIGLAIMLAGAALAVAVIANGQNPMGFQAEPPIPWTTLWTMVQIGFAVCAAAALGYGFWMDHERLIERIVLLAGGVFLAAVFAFLAIRGPAAFIGDSAMRIVWQLLQCFAPSLVILLGARMIFGRKAGMVIIHAGIAILMLNEIYTAMFAVEQRVQFFENEQVNYAMDLRHTELAIVDRTDPTNETHVVVPASRLIPGELLQDPRLPVDILCVQYFVNATIEPLAPGDQTTVATVGIGTLAQLRELPRVSGTEDQVDQAGAYVKLLDKETKRELGTFLVCLGINAIEEERMNVPSFPTNTFSLGDRNYHVTLRFKRYYKPYTLTLLDTNKESYLGTETARSYSSEFRLVDEETGIDVVQKVWMNNPLRYRDETFYQTNYDVIGGREVSQLQVVKNGGWMIPYFCCVFVGLGLVVQFGQTLLGYTRKLNKELAQRPVSRFSHPLLAWTPLLVSLLIVAGGLRSGTQVTAPQGGFRMDLLGQVPVVHAGRAKPLDSVARSFTRRASGQETVRPATEDGEPISATTWTADLLFGGSKFGSYPIFKIDDPNLRGSLSLEPRKRYRYSIDEVAKSEDVLRKIYNEALEKPEERRTPFDHRAMELGQLLFESRELQRLFNVNWDGKQILDLYYWSVLPDSSRTTSILVAPLPGTEQSWAPLSIGWFCHTMAERAAASGDATWLAAAQRLVRDEKDAVRGHEIRAQVFAQLTRDDAIRQQSSQMSAAQWQQFVFEQIRNAPLEELETMAGNIVRAIDKNLDAVLEEQAQAIATDLQSWMGGEEVSGREVVAGAGRLAQLKSAYQQEDADQFNTLLSEYLSSVAQAPPEGIAQWRQTWESFFNRLAPFYLATICYLVGFVLTILAWIVYPVWLNRFATAVMLGGWVLHVIGIVLSVGISGRAPVTSLYSSFVFVTSVVVGLFMLVERMTKMGFGNLLAGVLGVGGLLWAWNIALGSDDTFAVLVAVLDTNFWLSTHVICISLGYSATLAAGALGVTFILGGLLTPWLTPSRRQELTRLIYGTTCFALLFSFVGTVLGGLWADDSWGRFWGWDPKENGALMIVLWNAVVLHARWGGLVRQRGLAGLAVIGNAVTAWSWEGVNQLGVGLHSYGLSDASKFRMLVAFWAAQFVIAALAMIPSRFWLSRIDDKSEAKLVEDA